MFREVLMAVELENILDNPLGSALQQYSVHFQPHPGIFFGIAFIAIPTIIVGMKTDNVTPPLVTLILGSLMVSPLVGDWGRYFMLFAGIVFGVLLFILAKGARR